MRIAIVAAAFEPLAECVGFESANLGAGAIATFVGRCRAHAKAGSVQMLRLQHYPGFTEREIERFTALAVSRLGLADALVIHRVGDIAPGEAIVLIATASAHRAEALEGVQVLIDFLKTDAPFWKQEVTEAGATWVEPSALDYQRRDRLRS